MPLLVEGEGEWFVVRQDGEVPGLRHVPKVPHSLINSQEFPVLCAVLWLSRTQLSGEICEGLPDVLHPLLENDTHGGS